jgi:16S rRNA (uracil1498-N3)-methyltransferase
LRLGAGAPLTLFNGDGAEYAGVITHAAKGAVSVRIEGARAVARESPLQVVLAQGVSRGERMDYTVQKAVELGVARIEPVLTRRGVVRLDPERARQKTARWQAVAIAACEQCGRNRVPEVAPVRTLEAWLGQARARSAAPAGVLLDPAAPHRLADLPRPAAGVALLAGPEGGLSEDERRAAESAGLVPVRLGPRTLRTETAGLAAVAAMQALWGDF